MTPEDICEELAAILRRNGDSLSGADFIMWASGMLVDAGYDITPNDEDEEG